MSFVIPSFAGDARELIAERLSHHRNLDSLPFPIRLRGMGNPVQSRAPADDSTNLALPETRDTEWASKDISQDLSFYYRQQRQSN